MPSSSRWTTSVGNRSAFARKISISRLLISRNNFARCLSSSSSDGGSSSESSAGAVFDFLDFYIRAGGREWHWPAFNAADSGITVGVILLLFHGLFQSADRAKTEHS